ncbi:unnamed protein product [Pleuronectes platessa]|uniref:Uncharacterized protein n=1 Tax=Pleuronectes platessa TaxID=8262 RepID=A0A9N7VF76_PLEPL|nr:unnamed protein product [Pleuronectes platessa]
MYGARGADVGGLVAAAGSIVGRSCPSGRGTDRQEDEGAMETQQALTNVQVEERDSLRKDSVRCTMKSLLMDLYQCLPHPLSLYNAQGLPEAQERIDLLSGL